MRELENAFFRWDWGGDKSRRSLPELAILILLCSLSLAAEKSATGSTHPFSVRDLVVMDRISDPQISPDGRTIVFVLKSTDLDENGGVHNLWTVSLDGSSLRQLSNHPAFDLNPRWSPDGKRIWFLSDRSGSSQIWEIATDGGEARQVSHLPLDLSNLLVSPDGKRFLFTAEVYPDCMDMPCSSRRLQQKGEPIRSGRSYEKLFVRHWDTWKSGRRSHLFSMPIVNGKPVDLMKGWDADCPSKPFGGPEEIDISPDGTTVVFTARNVGEAEPWSTDFDLYRVPIDGSSKPLCITEANQAWDTQPVFSPDGKSLAYLAMSRPGFEADRFQIVLMSWLDGSRGFVSPQWDRSPNSLTWSSNGEHLFATADNLGQTSLFSVTVSTGQVRTLLKEGTVSSLGLADGRLVFRYDQLRAPAELFSLNPDGSGLSAVTAINSDKLSRTRMGDFEQFVFKGWNDETVYAYVVKPVDFDSNLRYPVAFLIHGGPQGSFGNHFHYRWNPQTYAGAGYAVIMVDFHGSTGYGQAFTDSITGDWGGKPLVDLRKGLEAAIRRYPWMDSDRVAALGASFGGYMINWIEGQWPDRFRCLVNHDGVFDMRSMYFTSEELWFPEWEQGGPYWENPRGHEEHNPVRYVKEWKTPMLVIHGALDFRVPLEQGLGAFTALKRQGIPAKFLYYPDENHWVLKPHNSIQWHETVLEWLDQWLK